MKLLLAIALRIIGRFSVGSFRVIGNAVSVVKCRKGMLYAIEKTKVQRSFCVGLVLLGLFFSLNANASGTSDKEHYRRSSLCLILLTHGDKKYAEEMERVFNNFPLPLRYNEHNISIRCISVKGKWKKKDIDYLLNMYDVARKVVEKWFNRNYLTGRFDMDLIHERGGYGAFYEDYKRAQSNVRGIDMLRDEGIELLQNTFVLVCDMDYIDKKKGAGWASLAMALAAGVGQAASQYSYMQAQNQYNKGNYSAAQTKLRQAQTWNSASQLGMAGAAVVADIGGFRVKMHAYLYKLKWDDSMTSRMFNEYWYDNTSFNSSANETRKRAFDSSPYFKLEYIGDYKTSSSKTILRSWSNEDEVILDVCHRCVNKGIDKLAKKFKVFRPRAPFYFDGPAMYSRIGTKEDVKYGKKYEVLQPYKDKKGQIKYKRVGKVSAYAPWHNQRVRFDEYFDVRQKGTRFKYKKAKVDLHTPGLQLREM
ncbi:MAG: hypothetical protein IJ328_06580 [Muribaculaceae bacterium]|nr:hypothetical protein [Muribaculaceae bacterium]